MKHKKSTVLDRDRERVLTRIATRGVVKFFNVLKEQQKDIENKVKSAGPYERKIDKIYSNINKGSFLDRLKEETRDDDGDDESDDEMMMMPTAKITFKTSSNGKTSTESTDVKPSWNVLRDDYVMGGDMKEWNDNKDDELKNGDNESSNKNKNKNNFKNKKLKKK